MTTTDRTLRLGAFLGPMAALLLGAAALAQEVKTQEIDAKGIKFDAPAAWKSIPFSSPMRRAQLKISPATGDEEGAELIVFAFPGGAGSVDANVARWKSQFKDKDGNPPKAEVTTLKAKNAEVNRVEMAGHWFPAAFPGQPQQPDRENYRLVAGIVLTDTTGYFLRLVGPEKTVSAAKADFAKLLASVKVQE